MGEKVHGHDIDKGTVLLYFWAPSSKPCAQQEPVIRSLVGKIRGRATIVAINAEATASLAGQMRVTTVPVLVILQDGDQVRRFVGIVDEQTIMAAIPERGVTAQPGAAQDTGEPIRGPIGPPDGRYVADATGNAATIGCFLASIAIFGTGLVLWLARPASWGVPGVVWLIVMGIGLSGIKVGWDMFKGK